MENHVVTIDNRQRISITDISEIDSFDEEEIRASLNDGAMIIRGEKLHIQTLDLAAGRAEIATSFVCVPPTRKKTSAEGALQALFMSCYAWRLCSSSP